MPKDKALYKQTVEPIFGIIKEVLGFRRFSMRGTQKAGILNKYVLSGDIYALF